MGGKPETLEPFELANRLLSDSSRYLSVDADLWLDRAGVPHLDIYVTTDPDLDPKHLRYKFEGGKWVRVRV